MAENKKSFVLYADLIHTVKKLSNEQAGLLFKHLLSYVNDENPVASDIVTEIAFEPIKQQLKRDLKHWEVTVQKKSEGGKKAMAKRWGEKVEDIKDEPKKEHQYFNHSKIPVEQYFESLIKGGGHLEVSRTAKIPVDIVLQQAEVFRKHAEFEYPTNAKFLSHFRNWLNKQDLNKTTTSKEKSFKLGRA